MKRLVVFLIVVLLILGVAGQIFLPKMVEEKIREEIEASFKPTQVSVDVSTTPAIKMLWGSIDSVNAKLEEAKLKNGLTLSTVHMNLKGLSFSVKDMLFSKKLTIKRIENGSMDLTLSSKNLTDYMEQHVKGLDHVSVAFDNEKIKLNGHFNLGGLIEGDATTKGLISIKNNVLVYAPDQFSINGFGVTGINMPIMKGIPIYNFAEFPFPVTATSVKTADEKVDVHLETKSE